MTPSWWVMTSSLLFQASTRKHIGRFLLSTLGRSDKCVFRHRATIWTVGPNAPDLCVFTKHVTCGWCLSLRVDVQ